jgi:hypothetical protein
MADCHLCSIHATPNSYRIRIIYRFVLQEIFAETICLIPFAQNKFHADKQNCVEAVVINIIPVQAVGM